MTRGAFLIHDADHGWRGIVFAVGSSGKNLYETKWYELRESAKCDVDNWLSNNNVRIHWLADSRPMREH